MQTNVVVILKKSKGFDEKLWTMAQLSDNKLAVEYELIHHLDVLRERHETYLAKWTTMISEIKITQRQGKPVWYALAKDVIATVLQGMRMLSDLTARVLLQAAWKYAKPNNNPEFKDITDYERAIKLNYNKEERYALVEVLAMIKGVLVVMLGADTLLAPIIRRHIHDQLQEFIQHELRELMAKTMKSTKPKKRFLQNELLTLRFFAADWYNSAEPQDVALEGKKPKENEKFNIPTRTVAPSSTQLDMIRNMLFGFMHQTGKKQMYSESDLGGSSQKIFADFYHQSFFYRYLLDYTTTLREITDVGDLWYREFYLDLNERIQFPIDMSLPWILTDHILESGNTSMMEYVLYPLDIYNDAASRALNELKSRFLYDEIEAEVNLAFEQLVYKLTNQIYTYCKIQASSIMLDKPYKQQLELNFPDRVFRFHVPKSRFGVLLQQRHIKLLGRSIDFADLLTQRVNNMIRANLDLVIARFEAADITSIIELETMLDNIKLTHHLLSQYLPLDQFDALLAEVNESTSLVSLHGRILLHIIFELTIDLTPNFVYNMITQRFIRAPHIFTDPVPRQPMPKSDNPTYLFGNKPLERGFMSQLDLTRPFVGLPHLKSIIRIIGKSNLSLLISEILENMKLKLVNVLHPYVKELMEGLPLKSTLPRFDYGLEGGFGYFPLKLKMIIEYPDLVNQVFQHFREWGNSLVLLNLFDIALAEHDQISVVTAAPFLGIVPNKLYNLSGSDVTPMLNVMKTLQANLEKNRHIAKSLEALNDLTVSAQKADKLYRPTVENYSLFKNALVQITQALEPFKEEWFGFPDNPQMQPDNEILPVEQSFEFYRFWSGLQFVFLIDIEANAALGRPSMELFGDGIHWAGCAIINALQQKQRFNVFDFAYHVSKMGEVLAATNDVSTTNTSLSCFFYSQPPPPPLSYAVHQDILATRCHGERIEQLHLQNSRGLPALSS
jgi:cytoplasmic FMR1 interacting protein